MSTDQHSGGDRVYPFRPSGYTQFHNALFDHLMPRLSPNAWKVVCYLVRNTNGWHREATTATVEEIQRGTGMGSNNTAIKALSELKERAVVLAEREHRQAPTTYRLNEDFTLDAPRTSRAETAFTSSAETASLSNAETAPLSSAETAPHNKESVLKKTNGNTDVLPAARQPQAPLKDRIRAQLSAANAAQEQAVLRELAVELWGEEKAPSYQELGIIKRQAGSAERAADLLLRYALDEIRGNVAHYIMAASARERERTRRIREAGIEPEVEPDPVPVHLSRLYTTAEVELFVSSGYARDLFHVGDVNPTHGRLYRYIDPSQLHSSTGKP